MDKKDLLVKLINDVLTVDAVHNGEFIETYVNVEEIAEHLLMNWAELNDAFDTTEDKEG